MNLKTKATVGLLTAVPLICSLGTAHAQAETLLEFDFQNFSGGQKKGSQSAAVPGITGIHDMAYGGAETFGTNILSITRFAGTVYYPELIFTTTETMTLESIEFTHIHNHNPGYPTYPTYDVDVQLDTGSGYESIEQFTAQPGGYTQEQLEGPGLLLPGIYKIRWIASALPNTNTEFFGLDDIRLSGIDVQSADVDIKPGDNTNSINLCSKGNVPVAILGSDELDINDIDPDSLRFSGAEVKIVGKKDPKSLCSSDDVNSDGHSDLVCHFETMDIGSIDGSSTEATVLGTLYDTSRIEGLDGINIVKDTCN
jgi:hypothetical protein